MIIDGYTAELLINRAIGGTTLKESVKALQDVFVDHELEENGEPMSDPIGRQVAVNELIAMREHIDASMSIVGCIAYDMAIEALRQPEIIRCKDCKFYTSMIPTEGLGICSLAGRHLGDDGFCSEAERRNDADH